MKTPTVVSSVFRATLCSALLFVVSCADTTKASAYTTSASAEAADHHDMLQERLANRVLESSPSFRRHLRAAATQEERHLIPFCETFVEIYFGSLFDEYNASDEIYTKFRDDICACGVDCSLSDTECISACALQSGTFNIALMLIIYEQLGYTVEDSPQCIASCQAVYGTDTTWSCESACSCAAASCAAIPNPEFEGCIGNCFCDASSRQVDGQGGVTCPIIETTPVPTKAPTMTPTMTPTMAPTASEQPSVSSQPSVSAQPSVSSQPSASMEPSTSMQPSPPDW
ncbi:hypothetical protein ACA910_004415 [Epithemia clementina (nom. ined.)]